MGILRTLNVQIWKDKTDLSVFAFVEYNSISIASPPPLGTHECAPTLDHLVTRFPFSTFIYIWNDLPTN